MSDFNEAIIGKRRTGKPNDPYKSFNITLPIINSRASLPEIPNRFEKVKVTGYTSPLYEVEDGELTEFLYKVDYTEGVVFFNPIHNNKSYNFSFLGEGYQYFPSNRVWVTQDETGDVQTVTEKFDRVDADIASQKARVDQQVISTPQPYEVVDMRIDRNGVVFPVAKDRIDAEQKKIEDATYAKNGMNFGSLKERLDHIDDDIEATNVDISLLDDKKAEKIRKVSVGDGLLGGGDLTADRTISVNFGGTGVSKSVAHSDHDHGSTYLKQAGGKMTGDIDMGDKNILGANIIRFNDQSTGNEGLGFLKTGAFTGSTTDSDYDAFRVLDGTGYLNDKAVFTSDNEVLWTGTYYMNDGQVAVPSKKLSQCPNGWILIWSDFTNDVANNYDFNFTYIPKAHARLYPSTGVWAIISTTFGSITGKYIFVSDTAISGHQYNDDGTDGRNNAVLRHIFSY
jgi:hypothetical protein